MSSSRSNLSVVILAAGKGQRMRSSLPKVLHQLAGVPMLERVVNAAEQLKPRAIHVVYGNGGQAVRSAMTHLDVNWVEQRETLGTGHAMKQVLPSIPDEDQLLVLYGDVPLISVETLEALLDTRLTNGLSLVVSEFDNPGGLGRIIRNELGNIIAIVEERDADEEQLNICEVNTGIISTSATNLKKWVPKLRNQDNAQREYYLTDIVALAVADGHPVGGILAHCQEEVRGVNRLDELAELERFYQYRTADALLARGVRVMDPHRFDLRGTLDVGADVTIDINVVLEGKVVIGDHCHIEPGCVLRNVVLGDGVRVKACSVLEDAVVGNDAEVGPFARLRPGAVLDQNVRIGNFVEVKNSHIGAGSTAGHLSYLGDAQIGKEVTIGAGTITCNYDGVAKHKTVIGDNALIGSDTQLIAPVAVGANATIGAGSTIVTDAPADQLTLSRVRQQSVSGWESPRQIVKKATADKQ